MKEIVLFGDSLLTGVIGTDQQERLLLENHAHLQALFDNSGSVAKFSKKSILV